MTQDAFSLLALSLIPGLGVTRVHRLLDRFGEAPAILRLSRSQLRQFGLSREIQAYILTGQAMRSAETVAEGASRKGVRIVSRNCIAFPQRLKEIYDPPLILYLRGQESVLSEPSVAVVGSRKSSIYGEQMALKFAQELGELGLTIVSGLARGIDSKAHLGVLKGGGKTVAVLGTGVDVIYPRENRSLFEKVGGSGCIVSEFPMGTYPAPQNFPIRNRIISGLCFGTLIPEASEFSGSLITARLTLEQDRELWAVPGNITNPGSYGPNYLIKQGAKPVLSVYDILEELPVSTLRSLEKSISRAKKKSCGDLTGEQQELIDLLSVDAPVHVDQLSEKFGQDSGRLNRVLLDLELRGLIRQFPGRRYVRCP